MALAPIPVNSLLRHIAPLKNKLSLVADHIIQSGYYVLGPHVALFEQSFAEYCGAAHCVGVANGTDALELALKAAGVAPGDHVAVTANAAMYGTTAVLACQAIPVFLDVTQESSTLAPAALKTAIENNPNLKAVVVTHLYGRIAAIEEISLLCRANDIMLVEDCAQAHGATLHGRRAGTFGDVASFSFYPTKNLGALGDGGAVVTDDAAIFDRVSKLRQYGWTQKYTNGFAGGRNSRLDEIQAAMLLQMLPLLDAWNARRLEIANRYSGEICHTDIVAPSPASSEYVAHLYVIKTKRRDELRKHLAEAGIQTEVHYPLPDHKQPCHEGRYDAISLPVTESDAQTVLTLPCFPELTDDEVQRVIDSCNQF